MTRCSLLLLAFASCKAPPAAAPVATRPAAVMPATAAPEPAPVAASAVKLAVLPSVAYVERTDGGLHVNCDLRVENTSRAKLTLTTVQVSGFDRSGALLLRKLIDSGGVSPGITVVPNRELAPGETRLVLNPLHTFPGDLDLARVDFELTYAQDGLDHEIVVTASVAPQDAPSRAALQLPVRGRLLVWDGHDFLAHHRRWDYLFPPIRAFGFTSNAGRYSYDLVTVDAAGEMRQGDAKDNASWFSFGQPVLAPAAGTVVGVVGTHPDDRQFDQAKLSSDLMLVYGNYVVIEHAPGEVSVFAHLQQHSPKVKVGDRVVAGQPIAAIGASGSANFPHLHYQLQNAAGPAAEGVPSYFRDFVRIRGAKRLRVVSGAIESGELVESAATSATSAGSRR